MPKNFGKVDSFVTAEILTAEKFFCLSVKLFKKTMSFVNVCHNQVQFSCKTHLARI